MCEEDLRKCLRTGGQTLLALASFYLFFVSINLMGAGFKLLGGGFTRLLFSATSNPFAGLLLGVVVTSIVQSSSATTSTAVGLVAAGTLNLRNAIPIIMGANIGTTVTNTIVSLGHVTRRTEFERAFAAATVHDFFNIFAVLVIFPLEMAFRILERSSSALSRVFVGVGGITVASPLKTATAPLVNLLKGLLHHPILVLLVAFALLFFSLQRIVRIMRRVVSGKMSLLLDAYLFRNDAAAFLLGLIFTSIVQSSSVTTSIVVPLVGSGLVTVPKIFPYTLGANMGTTVTAILASLATSSPVAITVAFSHLLFNVAGILVFYPLRVLPIKASLLFARSTVRSRRNLVTFLVLYFLLHFVPLCLILLFK